MRGFFFSGLAMAMLFATGMLSASQNAPQSSTRADCREWQECRQFALEAAERGRYESFHDFAWRAIQTGPASDPDLMFLLARAQGASGRPYDALITLRRLAEMGVAFDVSGEDFYGTRQLAGWPQVEALFSHPPTPAAGGSATPPLTSTLPSSSLRVPVEGPVRLRAPVQPIPTTPAMPAPSSAARSAPAAPSAVPIPAAAPAIDITRFQPLPVQAAARFSTGRFALGGFAYDAVSRRFVFGDLYGRKLMVVGEGLDRTVDMVRAESAGFHDVTALEIDPKRGDLWVVSTEAPVGTLHKLNLISGRPLAHFEVSTELQPVRLTDVAVTGSGTVLVLDSESRQLLGLTTVDQDAGSAASAQGRDGDARRQAMVLVRLMRVDVADATSLAPAGDEQSVYVAHRDGLLRLDLKTRTAAAVTAPNGIDLGNFERLRSYRDALVGVQALANGSRRVVQLELNRTGRAVTGATVIDVPLPPGSGPTFATLSGDQLYYVVAAADGSSGRDAARGNAQVVVRRIQLH